MSDLCYELIVSVFLIASDCYKFGASFGATICSREALNCECLGLSIYGDPAWLGGLYVNKPTRVCLKISSSFNAVTEKDAP